MMKDKLFPMGWAAALILLTGCQQEMVTEVATKAAFQEPEQESIYVAGTANILLDEETVQWIESGMPETRAAASFNNAVGEIGMNRLERIFPDAGEFEQRSREMGLHRWYRIHFSPSVEKNQARDILRQVDGIKAFEPVVKAKKMNYPFNDPQFGSQWQYRNDGSKTDWVAGADMQVIPVWRYFTTGDPAVSVAVVDGGVQLNHEDLAGNIDATNSHNFVNDSDYVTPNDHGTHVAGTIAAVNNNGLGVARFSRTTEAAVSRRPSNGRPTTAPSFATIAGVMISAMKTVLSAMRKPGKPTSSSCSPTPANTRLP